MITFGTNVRIDRPVEEVFAYVSEPFNFPRWNSAVENMRTTSTGEGGLGSKYVMERELPTGRAINEVDVVASEPPREFAIRATTGPTPFLYRYRFVAANGETIVHVDAEVELPGPARSQERCGSKPRDAEADSRGDSWRIASRLTATPRDR